MGRATFTALEVLISNTLNLTRSEGTLFLDLGSPRFHIDTWC